ncbi:EAL domain-containing protein [Nocardioides iriomotensis]|nr:EAL domain-containing protein [Nocardioides iriomotensis]
MRFDRWSVLLVAVGVLDVTLTVMLAMDEFAGLRHGRWWSAPVLLAISGAGTGVVLIAGVMLVGRWLSLSNHELQRRGEELDATARTTEDWLWESDTNGVITYSSPGVEALLGYSPSELVGRQSMDLLVDEDARQLAAGGLGAAAGVARDDAAPWGRLELRWRHRDGHAVWLSGAGVPMRDRRGRVFGFRGTRRRVDTSSAGHDGALRARGRVLDLLSHGRVRVALQPIIDLESRRMVGAEGLARFGDGRGPRLWFQDAEAAGLTRELDELTFFAAVDVLRTMRGTGYLSVNASPALLLDATFRARLLRTRVDLTRLVIELTEHDRVADYAELNTALTQLRTRGVRFAIDDTGAGYSSLNHVLNLRPDIIKLDRDLIVDLESDRARRALVTALVLVALETGSVVLGEGTETAAQLDLLSTLGVDQAQGYAIAHPSINPAEWHDWLNRRWLPDPAPAVGQLETRPTPADT